MLDEVKTQPVRDANQGQSPGEGNVQGDLDTIRTILGISDAREMVSPVDPHQIADQLTVTFRPLPDGYSNQNVVSFRENLREQLEDCGVTLLSWEEAREEAQGIVSALFDRKMISGEVDVVVDVKREYSLLRNALTAISDTVYEAFLRSAERSVGEILTMTAWAEHLPKHYVQQPFNTQILTLKSLDPEFSEENVSYERKISIGLSHLINTMSEFVIGVSEEQFALINMNMSDAVYDRDDLRSVLKKSFIPKTGAAIRPPLLTQFERDTFDPRQSTSVNKLVDLGHQLEPTDLFPRGTKFNDFIERRSRRDVLDRYLDGRTGVSYGFIGYVEPPEYEGPKELAPEQWRQLQEIEGENKDLLRQNDDGRWFFRTSSSEDVRYRQVPDLLVSTSRSGCNKTNLDPNRDVVQIGVRNGRLQFRSPEGVDLDRKDVRPSFDTYVIIANALATALYAPDLLEGGAPMLHFHGYPDPSWFREGESYTGASNLSMSCGTVEAAMLNYSAIRELTNTGTDPLKLLCIVEPDHGVNILGKDVDYVVSRVKEGCENDRIELGGKYLQELR